MKKGVKFILVLVIALLVYWVSISWVPGIPFLKHLSDRVAWISPSLWVQATLLLCSIILILIFGRGKFASYGFRGTGLINIIKPFFIAFLFAFVLFILNMIHIRVTGPPQGSGKGPLSGDLIKDIVYIWIIASMVEEIFFRGFVVTFLQDLKKQGIRLGRILLSVPVLVAALLFSLMHLCLWDIMPHRIVYFILINTFFLGLIAGYWREKTGSLIPAYVVHLIFNVVGMIIPRLLIALVS
ncbi:MAG: CPBP family intramembrane metalloprotease [Candidatus Cloacimonetes bacterium]|nr:CPBP family intramembrane metalloprotease [Candidatus Cloacimonadota bacterium]